MTEPRKPRVRTAKVKDARLPQAVLIFTVSLYEDHSIARVVAAPTLHDARTDRLLGAVRLDSGRRDLRGLSAPAASRVIALSVGRAMYEVEQTFRPAAGVGVPLGGPQGEAHTQSALPGL